jgi:hypothetical protein
MPTIIKQCEMLPNLFKVWSDFCWSFNPDGATVIWRDHTNVQVLLWAEQQAGKLFRG